jgi:signal transduction histidine kinase/DNA-binding NarL/FixJ family response regulator
MQMITFLVAIIICVSAYLYFDYRSLKKNKVKSTLVIAEVIALNSEAPLIFSDSEAANSILKGLKAETDITHACIVDSAGNLLGSYVRQGEKYFQFESIPNQNVKSEFTAEDLFIYYKIKKDGEWLGTLSLKTELTEIMSQFYNKVKIVGLIVIFGFFIAFFVAAFLQKYISKPIIDLAGLMGDVIQKMNYRVRARYNGTDEIGKLSRAFNNMLEKIEKHEHVLSETNSQLEMRVEERTTELKHKNEKLFEANALAEQSTKAKEQFLATMSHEIRTPLNAILGFQKLLKDTKLDGEQQEYVESIDFAGKNLLVIINDILDLSKIEAGKFDFNLDALNVKQALSSVKELIEFNAREKNIQLVLNHDEEIPETVIGDGARFNQILLNLVGNAVKFTDKGTVTIGSKLISDKGDLVLCEFTITDTGIGIPQDKLGLIFERFTQATPDTTRKYGGTGLGLTIVKQLLNLQGGKITVESEEGKGSTFTFYLPFTKAKNQSSQANAIKAGREIPADKLSSGRKIKILAAEDTPLNQKLLKKIVFKWDHDLDVAVNGKEAITLLEKNNYDIILMDIQMPEMDGYTATKIIRALTDERKKHIPIIALTAHASNDEAQKCLGLGMNAYISKPFDSNVLLNTIFQLIEKTDLMDATQVYGEIAKSEQLYDLSYIKEHASGDNDFLIDMISTCLHDTPPLLDQLKSDITEKDYEKIKVTSHSMKGLFLTLGMNEAARLLREIETLAQSSGEMLVISSNYNKIENMFKQAKSLLELELDKLKV